MRKIIQQFAERLNSEKQLVAQIGDETDRFDSTEPFKAKSVLASSGGAVKPALLVEGDTATAIYIDVVEVRYPTSTKKAVVKCRNWLFLSH